MTEIQKITEAANKSMEIYAEARHLDEVTTTNELRVCLEFDGKLAAMRVELAKMLCDTVTENLVANSPVATAMIETAKLISEIRLQMSTIESSLCDKLAEVSR